VKRADLRKERTKMMNRQISPMLAKASAPFDNPDYLFEIKWDGERAIAFVENGKIVRLQNRRLQDVSRCYPEIIGSPVEANEAILMEKLSSWKRTGSLPSPSLPSEATFKTRSRSGCSPRPCP
jgi:hypothetical protein